MFTLEKCMHVHVHVHDACMHACLYTDIGTELIDMQYEWTFLSYSLVLSLSPSLSHSLSLSFSHSPRLLQHKFFIRASKTEVKPKSSVQSGASSSKESESSTLRKRGEKATDSPRAKKVNQQIRTWPLNVSHCRSNANQGKILIIML